MVFSLNIRFHTESWPKWDSSPQPRAYHAHDLTTVLFLSKHLSKNFFAENRMPVFLWRFEYRRKRLNSIKESHWL